MNSKPTYQALSQFVLRTPLLPFGTIDNIALGKLNSLYNQPLLQEALFIASPVLYDELQKWLTSQLTDKKEIEKLQLSLMRYLLRMSSRCTPFGLFAGCSVGSVGDLTQMQLAHQHAYKRHTRLDMNYLCALAESLAKHPVIKPHLQYFPNSGVYANGDKLRYVEYRFRNKRRTHYLVAVDDSEYVQAVLQAAQNGASLHTLTQMLCNMDADIVADEAQAFIEELVTSQVLVPELEPSVTGPEFIAQIIAVLERIPQAADLCRQLTLLQEQINGIDAQPIGADIALYQNIVAQLSNLPAEYELAWLFQTDMVKPLTSCTLSRELVAQVAEGIALLSRFTTLPAKTNISEFINTFTEHYEEQEIPLTDVLDSETGIGYLQSNTGDVNPLVDDLGAQMRSGNSQIEWNLLNRFVLKKYSEALLANEDEVIITDKDLEDLPEPDLNDLPNTLAGIIKLIKPSDTNNSQPLIAVHSMGGSSAANLLGRFCHADSELHHITQEITDKEAALNPSVIYAEIIHLPEARLGNILLRPVLRPYEIPFLAKSAVDKEFQIELTDLMLSVRKGRVFLRSKRLDKEVIPRLTTAHNYTANSLAVYHFLCDLQTQHQRGGVGFNWGFLSSECSFLPRVRYKQLILAEATWNLKKNDFEALINAKDDSTLIQAVADFRQKHKMPRYIAIADGDNELVIDFENTLCMKVLADSLKKRHAVKIIEFLFNNEQELLVQGPEGGYTNEIILAFWKDQKEAVVPDTDLTTDNNEAFKEEITDLTRSFAIGSEWLYYKFYTGYKTADTLLADVIGPFCNILLQEKIIDKWFFIRYNDPKPHLRVRFHNKDVEKLGQVSIRLNALLEAYMRNGLVWKVQTDTYQREIERYGSDTMELAEELFYQDSKAITAMLSLLDGDEGEQLRWLLALRNIDSLLSDFSLSLAEKLNVMNVIKESFFKEFSGGKQLKVTLDNKFRAHRPEINQIMDYSKDGESEYVPIFDILKQRTLEHAGICTQIIERTTADRLHTLLGSYIHMTLNRLFKSKQRMQEMVIYDFLYKYYKSEMARAKSGAKAENSKVLESN